MSTKNKQPASPAFANGKSPGKIPRFKDYTGGKQWRVHHPDFGCCTVIAPSNPAAIVVAADVWGQTWTAIGFYASCTVSSAGEAKGVSV